VSIFLFLLFFVFVFVVIVVVVAAAATVVAFVVAHVLATKRSFKLVVDETWIVSKITT
jgi:hypothetical protein